MTVTNTGKVDIPAGSPATVTDDLSGVLAHAAYAGDAHADRGAVMVSGQTLTWTGGLDAGQTATITYSVNVASGTPIGTKLVNVAIADPTLVTLGLDGDPGPTRVSVVTAVGMLALTGATIVTGLSVAAILLAVGSIALLLFGFRRRRGESRRRPAEL